MKQNIKLVTSPTITGVAKIDEELSKLCSSDKDKPHYVIVGLIKPPDKDWISGNLAFAKTEWNAYSIRRILQKFAENPKNLFVCYTEWNPKFKEALDAAF